MVRVMSGSNYKTSIFIVGCMVVHASLPLIDMKNDHFQKIKIFDLLTLPQGECKGIIFASMAVHDTFLGSWLYSEKVDFWHQPSPYM